MSLKSLSLASAPAGPAAAPSCRIDWEVLVRRHSPSLRRYLSGRVRRLQAPIDSDAAEEIVQETWCRIFERAKEPFAGAVTHGEGATRAFLFHVAARIFLDRVRQVGTVKRGGYLVDLEDGLAMDLGAQVRDPHWNPEIQFLVREGRRNFLRECLRLTRRSHRCDLRQRNLRILRRALLEGWSSQEIVRAERGRGGRISPSTVDTMISRARSRFSRAGWRLPSRGTRCGLG